MSKRLTTRQRVERLTDSLRHIYDSEDREAIGPPCHDHDEVVDLLLKEHRRLRAKVRKLRNQATASKFLHIEETVGYKIACDDILKAMK